MKLNRAAKEKLVEGLKEKAARANATFIAEYKGIKAVDMNEIRASMRAASVEIRVMRNTLARRAAAGTPVETLKAEMKGQTALVFSYKDAAAAAKKLVQFAKDQPNLKIKAGTLGGRLITVAEIQWLAELPPKEVLIARLLGSVKAPVSGIVGVLAGVPRKFVFALEAVRQQKAASAG